jgi:hypothetical protein
MAAAWSGIPSDVREEGIAAKKRKKHRRQSAGMSFESFMRFFAPFCG